MGSSASKPVGSAARAASRRQYPKKPAPPQTPKAPNPSKAKASAPPAQSAEPIKSSQSPPSPAPPSKPQGPTYHSKEKASITKSNEIDLDGRDPDFAASLRTIGPVNPFPTLSHSSAFNTPQNQSVFPASANPALLALTARQQISKAAEKEVEDVGKPSFGGREFLDAFTIRQALTMRDRQGLKGEEVEGTLNLKRGVIGRVRGDVFGVVW